MNVRVFIHAGALSADNGAWSPLSTFFELAKAVDGEAHPGEYYGSDVLSVPAENWPCTEALLIEAKLLYRPVPESGTPAGPWLNQLTDAVKACLQYQDQSKFQS